MQAKRMKRRLAADANAELTGAYIRQRLEPDGANDISRVPYEEGRNELSYESVVLTTFISFSS